MSIDLASIVSIVAGALVQDSLTCVVTGVLLAQGKISWVTAWVGCFLGVIIGDLIWVSIGRLISLKVIEGWLNERNTGGAAMASWREWMRRHRLAAIFISRFTPGFQVPLHLMNGYLSGGVRRSLPAYVLVAIVYVGIVMMLSYWMADSAQGLMEDGSSSWILFAVGLGIWLAMHLLGRLVYSFFRGFVTTSPTPDEH